MTSAHGIGRLERVPLREVWRNEAHNFTTWLADNLDLLGECLHRQLTLVSREAGVGPFSADIVAEDAVGGTVIIENQLEPTDHDHLGKLITYMSNLNARTAVWLTSQPRAEHEQAVHWLNEFLPADMSFYLVRIQAYRIEGSKAAPLFTVVAGPSAAATAAGAQKKEMAERHVKRREFWTQLLAYARTHTPLHSRIAPGIENWLSAGSGRSGIQYQYIIRMTDAQVEIYIDRGNVEDNERIFDQFLANKGAIEERFGGPLDWQRLDEKRGCRIRSLLVVGGLRDEARWPEIRAAMVGAMMRLEQAFKPEIQKLGA
jgi:hypothetical protein